MKGNSTPWPQDLFRVNGNTFVTFPKHLGAPQLPILRYHNLEIEYGSYKPQHGVLYLFYYIYYGSYKPQHGILYLFYYIDNLQVAYYQLVEKIKTNPTSRAIPSILAIKQLNGTIVQIKGIPAIQNGGLQTGSNWISVKDEI